MHFFFRLNDGSFIAVFDLGDDEAALRSPNTPLWVNPISLRVATVADLEAMKMRLQVEGIEVLGVTDHHIFKSIYFFDPNGVRLESTAQPADANELKKGRRPKCGWPNGQRANCSDEKRTLTVRRCKNSGLRANRPAGAG